MKSFKALLGVSFKSMLLTTFGGASRGKKRAKAVSGIGAFVLLCILMLFISASYSFSMGISFAMLGALDVMLLLMTVMSILYPFVLIIYGAQAMVFNTKDVDLVLSLPVSSFSVMLSRVLALYLEALVIVELLLVPSGVAYLLFGGTGGFIVIPMMILMGVFMALIPTTLALVFGALVSLIVSRIPFKNLFNIIFSILFLGLILVGTMSLSMSGAMASEGGLDPFALRETINGIFPPLGWAVSGMFGNVLGFLGFVAVCVVPFLLAVLIFSRFYKRILTGLASHRSRNDYKLREVKATGSFGALFAKEARKFFGTPAYVLNSGVGILLTIIGCVVALVKRRDILDGFASMSAAAGMDFTGYLAPIVLAAVMFMGSMVFISCVSISLEGKTLWILKEAPVSVGKLFTAKAGFNFLMCAVTCVVAIPMLGLAFYLPVVDVVLMLLVALLYALLTSALGLQINLWFPRMDAENDTVVIKQSTSVIITMLADWLLYGGLVALYFAIRGLGFAVFCLIAIAILAALSALVVVLLNTQGRKAFAAL